MLVDAALGAAIRAFLKALFSLGEPARAGSTMMLGFGPEIGFHDNPYPPMEDLMANGTVNKKRQIIVKVDGEVAGPPTFASSDPAVVELREEGGVTWAYQLTQGSAEITVNQPLPGGQPDLVGAGLLVINDPADDATIVELEFGAEEDV